MSPVKGYFDEKGKGCGTLVAGRKKKNLKEGLMAILRND